VPTPWQPMVTSPKRMSMDYRFKPCARSARVVLLSAVALIIGAGLSAGEVTLAWDANSEVDLAGYRLYYGLGSGQYDEIIDVGNVTTNTVTGLEAGLTYYFVVTAYNTAGLESDPSNEVSYTVPLGTSPDSRVVGRHIFYNQCAWDGNNAAANALDDGAIASDKQALLPGQTATFANYTSYSRGINGIMIDIDGLAGTPTVDDFGFKVGNNNDPKTWAQAPLPTSITVRKGAGVDGSDRITLIWPNWPKVGSIAKQWLQVTVQATLTTDLADPDVFYFGNAIGETGDLAALAMVSSIDVVRIQANYNTRLNPAQLTNPYDLDRDKLVSSFDTVTAQANYTTRISMLQLITAPAGGAGLASLQKGPAPEALDATQVPGPVSDWDGDHPASGSVAPPGIILRDGLTLIRRWTIPGQQYRLQSASRVAGPWQDVPGADRTADASGLVEAEVPTEGACAQRFFRWIEVGSPSRSPQ